ncbi:MAG: sel1 repeat family protein [Nitrosomonas sp.]|nr:sel1 repeat family protein [Nitrosomonas sp.]
MFYNYKRLLLLAVMLAGLAGCAGMETNPPINYRADFYNVNNFNQWLAVHEFKLDQQEFLDTLQLAEQGHAEAQYTIGFSYLRGTAPRDLVIDPEKQDAFSYLRDTHLSQAIDWIRKSAEQGNPNGQTLLGHLYRYGVGVSHDPLQELFWYTKAAENGDDNAQNILGIKYLSGIGVSSDHSRGVEWTRKSAARGNLSARNRLNELFAMSQDHRMRQQMDQRTLNKLGAKAAIRMIR